MPSKITMLSLPGIRQGMALQDAENGFGGLS